jgi:hypothetical protein
MINMFEEYLCITRIVLDLYRSPDCLKIVDYKGESIITGDIPKILGSISTLNPKSLYFIKQLKNIFKSKVLHKKYLVSIVHYLILFKPFTEIRDLLVKSKTEIDLVLENHKISVQSLSNLEIFHLVCGLYPDFGFNLIEKIQGIEDIRSISIIKIKA